MQTTAEYDVVVIGAGPAGENVAGRCADGNLRTVIVERELVGGECSYWGCMPSKVLLRPGDVVAAAKRVPGVGGAFGAIDSRAVLRTRDEFIGHLDDTGQLPWLESKGIDFVRGSARLAGERCVLVEGSGGTVALHARRAVVIATGTRAAVPPIPGLAGARPWTNREALTTAAIPERLAVIGGGTIGVELAQAFRRLGSREVTVLEAAPRLVIREESFAAAELQDALEGEGISIRTSAAIERVERTGAGAVCIELKRGETIEADELLVATGRQANTTNLGVECIGLVPGRYLAVDDRLRVEGVSGAWLYAVGDCNGSALLTHMGKYQARIAGDVILGRDATAWANSTIVPRVTFTDPQIAAVGYTAEGAAAAGLRTRVIDHPLGSVAGAATLGRGIAGTARVVIDEDRKVVVGATFTGPGVQELVHAATIAIAGQVELDRLWHAVPSFPTVSEVWLRLLESYGL